ncbi:MAG: HAMP domain-containing protein, partial [Acidimicrobiia bacterium]|nr:HAMP domain-containing protein [Acidimicrobiia bacterium]
MRRRLVVVAAAITSMVVVAFLVPLALLVEDLAHDRAVSNAQRDAQAVASTLATLQPIEPEVAQAILGSGINVDGRVLSIVLIDGSVLGGPVDRAILSEVTSARIIVTRAVEGGEAIGVPVVGPEGTTVVHAFVPDSLLGRNVASAWLVLLFLGLFSVSLAVALADRLGRSLVDPVSSLAEAARAWAAGDLGVRVEPGGPAEVADTGRAFNQLADRFHEVLREEREEIADLSHRLRTPLTALQLDVDDVADDAVRGRLADDVDEVRRTVDFVITQARRPVREGAGASTDLAALVRDRGLFWAPLAEEQQRAWAIEVPPHAVFVPGHRSDLEAVVDALV